MNIHFYLNNEEETYITSFHDMVSNPFKVGDIVNLNVKELHFADYNKYRDEFRTKMIEDNEELKKLFKHTKVKIVREGKWVDFNVSNTPRLVIEYHCELV